MANCPQCGAAAAPGARFCASCGRAIATDGAPAAGADDEPEEVLFEGGPAVIAGLWPLLATILTLGIAALVYWVRSLSHRYKVTTRRIVIEDGLFSKHLENVELYRVTDFVVDQPFGQRLLGTGNLTVETTDKTTPEVRLASLKTDVRALYDRLRAAAERERRRRGIRIVDVE